MKKIYILVLIFFSYYELESRAAVTYELSGRVGDSLVSYLHAKWISFVYDIPLLYRPFRYSDKLKLDNIEQRIDNFTHNYTRSIRLTGNYLTINPDLDVLYIVPYFSEFDFEKIKPAFDINACFKTNWNNYDFINLVKKLIQPKDKINLILPENKISVALHIRHGGNFDPPSIRTVASPGAALKFPPEYFYIESLKLISKYYNNPEIYAYIFTDHNQPKEIHDRFKEQLVEFPNIQLDYRKTANSENLNVLEDLFSLTKFDCLIRPLSNFSLIASIIGDFQIEIYPEEQHWERDISIIDKIRIIKGKKFNNYKVFER